MKPAALLLLTICLTGCSTPGFWRQTPARIDAVDWNLVAEDHVRWLECRTPNYDRAVTMLREHPVVQLSPEQVREFWTEAQTPAYFRSNPPATMPTDGTHAYMIRGVAYDPALRCRVWAGGKNGPVWTHFQSWTEDSPVTAAFRVTHGSPVVVFLDSKPSQVYVTADLEGDGVLKGNLSHP